MQPGADYPAFLPRYRIVGVDRDIAVLDTREPEPMVHSLWPHKNGQLLRVAECCLATYQVFLPTESASTCSVIEQ